MELHTNSSNNTIYADADGDDRVLPRQLHSAARHRSSTGRKPVDGSDPATEWNGVLSLDETPGLRQSGQRLAIQRPTTGRGRRRARTARSARTSRSTWIAAARIAARRPRASSVLEGKKDFTLDSSPRGGVRQLSAGVRRADSAARQGVGPAAGGRPALKTKLAEQIAMLRAWDLRWSVSSVPTSLAVYWGDEIGAASRGRGWTRQPRRCMRASGSADAMLQALAAASDKLAADFGTWKTPWGDINRFQRLTGDIVQPFDDAGAERSGRLHLGALGLARVVRRAHLSGHEEDGTARAATASSPWSSSATACAPGR